MGEAANFSVTVACSAPEHLFPLPRLRPCVIKEWTACFPLRRAGCGVERDCCTYETVKEIRTKRGIWDTTWGMLPGISWKHERPLEEGVLDDGSAPTHVDPLEDDSRGADRNTSLFEHQPSAPGLANGKALVLTSGGTDVATSPTSNSCKTRSRSFDFWYIN